MDKIVDNAINSIAKHVSKSKLKLTYPETTIINNITAIDELNLIHDLGLGKRQNLVLSTVLYNENESPIYCTEYHYLLYIYLKYDIYKYTGLTYKDFMSLTELEVNEIVDMVISKLEHLNEIMDSTNNQGLKLDNDLLGAIDEI